MKTLKFIILQLIFLSGFALFTLLLPGAIAFLMGQDVIGYHREDPTEGGMATFVVAVWLVTLAVNLYLPFFWGVMVGNSGTPTRFESTP